MRTIRRNSYLRLQNWLKPYLKPRGMNRKALTQYVMQSELHESRVTLKAMRKLHKLVTAGKTPAYYSQGICFNLEQLTNKEDGLNPYYLNSVLTSGRGFPIHDNHTEFKWEGHSRTGRIAYLSLQIQELDRAIKLKVLLTKNPARVLWVNNTKGLEDDNYIAVYEKYPSKDVAPSGSYSGQRVPRVL